MSVTVITTVLIAATATPPAGPFDLTTLAVARDELQLQQNDSQNDAFLQRAITQVSATIRNECNRTFQVEAVRDALYIQQEPFPWQNPGGVYPLQLSRFPLVNSTPVAFTGDTDGTVNVANVDTTGLVAGMLVFGKDGSVPVGTAIQTVGVGSLVLTRATTSSVTGLSMNSGLRVVQQLGNGLAQTLTYGQDFTVDAGTGQLLRLDQYTGSGVAWEAVTTTVIYQAGFPVIPDDLVDATLQLVTGRYAGRGRDPNVVERTQANVIGSERFWVGSQPGQRGIFPPAIQSIVDNYRVPVIG